MINREDLLKALETARLATKGPWKHDQCGDVWTIKEMDTDSEEVKVFGAPLFRMIGTTPTAPNNPNAAHISTMNPSFTIPLIERQLQLEEMVSVARNALGAIKDYRHLHSGRQKDWDVQYLAAIEDKYEEALSKLTEMGGLNLTTEKQKEGKDE